MIEKLYEILKETPIDKETLMNLVPLLRELNEYEFYHPAHAYNVLDHSIKAAELVDDIFLRLVLIFHDVGKLNTGLEVPNYDKLKPPVTKFPNHEEESVRLTKEVLEGELNENSLYTLLEIIKYHDTPLVIHDNESVMNELIDKYGYEFVGMLLKVQRADLITHSDKYYNVMKPGLDNAFNVYELIYKNSML